MKTRLLILGGTGLLGSFFKKFISTDKRLDVFSFKRRELDLNKKNDFKLKLKEIKPDVIVNFSGLTNVDQCESNPLLARKLNSLNLINIIKNLNNKHFFIHLSTDQVYPGIKGLYFEENTGPVNVYGNSKLEGEINCRRNHNILILRTNIFGNSVIKKKSLSDFFKNALTHNLKIKIFSDIFFSPISFITFSEILTRIILKKRYRGVYNLGSKNGMSKAQFATEIARVMGYSTKNFSSINSDSILSRAKRPKDVRMSVSKFCDKFNETLPDLDQEIRKNV